MSFDVKLVIAVAGFLFNVVMMFGLLGVIHRTETPPLLQLTLIQPSCEFVKKIGIKADVNNGICTITIRNRKNPDDEGGTIEDNGNQLASISSGQVISRQQLDDGSDEPWSKAHKLAFKWLLAPALFMAFILFVLSLIKGLPEETKPRSEKPKPGESEANADKPDHPLDTELPTSGISNDDKPEDK